MERVRRSVLRNNEITWHKSSNYSLRRNQFTFNDIQLNPVRDIDLENKSAEKVIFDIIRNNSREKIEKLEIKHINGEQ